MKTLVSLVVLLFLTGCATDLRVSGGVGEHQNKYETSQVKAELRLGDTNGVYSYSRVEVNDNPSEDIQDLTVTGIGYSYENFYFEAATDGDYFTWNLRYEQEQPWGYTYGTLKHLDKFEGGNSNTTVTIGAGLKITEGVYLGPFYEVGNQEQKYTGDTYGLQLRIVR